tara:strand:+ start:10412 stop:11305 length:894 start_codon:yes stop_codon:yes gene_type:complete
MTEAISADQATDEILDDAYADLIKMDEDAQLSDSLELDDDEGGPQETTDDTSSQESKSIGYGELMEWLRENNPAGAEAMKSIQGNSSRLSNQVNDLSSKLESLETRMTDDSPATPARGARRRDPALANLSPQQWDLFRKMAAEEGMVRKADLDQQETERAYESHRERVLREGIEQFGEGFGSLDESGQFSFSPDVRSKIQEVTQRLDSDTEGITEKELFILAMHEDLIKAARAKGEEEALGELGGARLEDKRQRANSTVRKTGNTSGRKGSAVDKSKFSSDQITEQIIREAVRHMRG